MWKPLALSQVLLLGFCVVSRADLVGYWPFDGSADAAVGVDGIAVNGPIAGTRDRNGNENGALDFDGISQYVEIPGGGGLDGVSGGTISIWANWLGEQDDDCCGGTFGTIFARQADGEFSDTILTLNDFEPDFASVVWRQSGGPAPALLTSETSVNEGEWNHIAVVFGPDGSELFLNGESEAFVDSGPLPLNSNDSIPLTIGAWAGAGNGFASALIDDVAIFDDLLSVDQIQKLFDGTATPQNVGPGDSFDPIPVDPGPVDPLPGVLPEGALAATIHDVSSNLGDNTAFDRTAEHVVSLSGWSEGTHSINPEGNMWLNNGSFTEPNDLEPSITFDLGSVAELDSMKVWNYNETLPGRDELLGRGVGLADILVAGEDLDFEVLASEVEFDIAPGFEDEDFGQEIDLGTEARYVKFEIIENHDGDNDFVGLSEVIFFGTAPDSCTPSMGDIDGSGVVDFADFLVLSTNFGQSGDSSSGDVDCNGAVDFGDFLILSTNFGEQVGAASVPEPSGRALLWFGIVLGASFRRRSKSAAG